MNFIYFSHKFIYKMHKTLLWNLLKLKNTYDHACAEKESLLRILMEVELSEAVYNSNAIENSTLTLDATEKILLENILPKHHEKREVFEAVNLGRVYEYIEQKWPKNLTISHDLIIFLHGVLLRGISDDIAGRYRASDEYVRVGKHIAPPPLEVRGLMSTLIDHLYNWKEHILERILYFHLEFERIHPFCDGNGRIGRVLIDIALRANGYPPIIIKNRDKMNYYTSLAQYEKNGEQQLFENIFGTLLKESLHKRITYARWDTIMSLADIARAHPLYSAQSLTNNAKKQSMPAFRERWKWKIGKTMFQEWENS